VISDLRKQHAEVFKEFAPLIPRHQELAGKLIEIQRRMYTAELKDRAGEVRTLPRILTFSERDSLPAFEAMLKTLAEKGIQISEVIYDPSRGEFLIFSQ